MAVFSRIAWTTSPLQLSHCFITHLIFWLEECPVPKGDMKDNMLTINSCHLLDSVRSVVLVFIK